MIAFVWAQDNNGLIGKQGTLPWHLPNDLRFFKQVTTGHIIVMGRKTFDGMGKRLLPKRETWVMTRDIAYDANGALVVSVNDVIKASQDKTIYVIGGSEIFRLFMPYVEKLYMTKIHHAFDGDAYMCPIDFSQFTCEFEEEGIVDEKNKYPHTFSIYTLK